MSSFWWWDKLRQYRNESNELARPVATDDLLARAAERVARDNLSTMAADLHPDIWDFSAFDRPVSANEFTRGQLLASNLVHYNLKQLNDAAFMDGRSEESFPEFQLQMLAFATRNQIDYDARNNSLVFAGGALEIDLLEWKISRLFDDTLPVTDEQKMMGRVRIRAKMSRKVPNMIVNPSGDGIRLDTHEYVVQKLATEGGNDHLQIFVSPDYHTDALYIFTPDVLAVMDQFGSKFAYKFYDDELEIYAPAEVLTSGERIREACLLAVNVARQVRQQAVRYRDDRATDYARSQNNLAAPGRRMAPKAPLIAGGIVSVAFFLFYLLPMIIELVMKLLS